MIGAVVRTDLREAWRDRRLPVLLTLSLLLALAAAWTGGQRVSAYERDRTAAIAQDARSWDAQGRANPHAISHFGHYAFKPQTKLATFDPGLTPYLGSMIWMEAHWQDPAVDRVAEDAPEAQRFADLTPAWLLQVVAPLMIILLGFPLLARERETGLWRSIASTGVSPSQFLTAKTVSLVTLSAITLFPLLAGAVLGPAFSAAQMPADGLVRTLGLLGIYGLYLAAFIFVTLAVSAWSATANRAMAVLLATWVLSALIIPKLAANYADHAKPLPSAASFRTQMEQEINEGANGAPSFDERFAEFKQDLLKRYGVSDLKDLPLDFDALDLQWEEDYNAKILDREYGKLYATYAEQRRSMRAASLLSPVLAVREGSGVLAGVDELTHRHFANAAEQYRRASIRMLNDHMAREAKGAGYEYIAPASLWATIPGFTYQLPRMSALGDRTGPLVGFGVTAMWTLVGLLFAVLGMRRWSRV